MGLVFGESLLITMTGCALGIALTFPVTRAFGNAMADYFPIFVIDKSIFTLYIGASFMVGIVAAVFPTWQALRITIAEGLRRIE